jgi:hypothetical protein
MVTTSRLFVACLLLLVAIPSQGHSHRQLRSESSASATPGTARGLQLMRLGPAVGAVQPGTVNVRDAGNLEDMAGLIQKSMLDAITEQEDKARQAQHLATAREQELREKKQKAAQEQQAEDLKKPTTMDQGGGENQKSSDQGQAMAGPSSPVVSDLGAMRKGEWEFCSVNSECANQCCSKEYSDDGKLKCTPGGCGGSGGGGGGGKTNANDGAVGDKKGTPVGGDGKKPMNGGTDSKNNGGGGLSPGTVGGSFGVGGNAGGVVSGSIGGTSGNSMGGSVGGTSGATAGNSIGNSIGGSNGNSIGVMIGGGGGGVGGKGAWEFCAVNNECSNNCCSNKYSDDGKLKCTPGGC